VGPVRPTTRTSRAWMSCFCICDLYKSMGPSARVATPHAALPASAYPNKFSGLAPKNSFVLATEKNNAALQACRNSSIDDEATMGRRVSSQVETRGTAAWCAEDAFDRQTPRVLGAHLKNIWPASGAVTPL